MARNDIEYTAVLGMANISTANSNLDGTGTMTDVVVAADDVTINRVVVKATTTTTEGMVRLFVQDSVSTKLLHEVQIGSKTCSGTVPSTSQVVEFQKGFVLKKGARLRASTQVAESFNIIAEGLQWRFPASETKIIQVGVTAMADLSTANANLDGTGTLATLVVGADNGTRINSLSIKAIGNTDDGMIRLFIEDPARNIRLQREFRAPETKQTAVVPAYARMIVFPGGLTLPSGYTLMASTQRSNAFRLIVEGYSWRYAAV